MHSAEDGVGEMKFKTVMTELESLATKHTKKRYVSNGAKEPVFGVPTGKMKPLSKEIGINQKLAEELYATGNFDAMYFAGVIADAKGMRVEDYDRWMDDAYFFMLTDAVVSVTLSESDIAEKVADKWIEGGEELRMSAGWSTYCWLIGSQKDEEFSKNKLEEMLEYVKKHIHDMPPRAKDAMNNFVYTVATSYIPLHEEALALAETIGQVEVEREDKKSKILNAYEAIQKQIEKNRIGFKRKYVRC